jgi:hypothetical protein
MNKTKIKELLKQWTACISTGQHMSLMKANDLDGGLDGRIRRVTGQPVIFDIKTYENQTHIQNSLCAELPQWSDLIRSQPAIMDGWHWTRGDFIHLYFEHFRVVVEKLTRIVNQTANR